MHRGLRRPGYGPQNLVICTGLAGAILVAMGATGLGSIIRFIPKPVVTGFTAGIATYIFSTQVRCGGCDG
ncbi:uncharacterized protein HaLaN_12090, partial [Haematococcus lacustris]